MSEDTDLLKALLATGNPGIHRAQAKPTLTSSLEAKDGQLQVELNAETGAVNGETVDAYLIANGYVPEEWQVKSMRRSEWTMPNGETGESVRYAFERLSGTQIPFDVDAIDWTMAQEPHVHVGDGDYGFVLGIGDLQIGKALKDDTPMLTANRGWTTHGDIVPGDLVFGPDGLPKRVLAVTGSTVQELARITFDAGVTIDASWDHGWQGFRKYHPMNYRQGGPSWERRELRMTTREIADTVTRTRNGSGKDIPNRSFHVGTTEPIQFTTRHLPIDPYVLGFWLGDGNSWTGTITKGHEDADWLLKMGHRIDPNGHAFTVRVPGLTEALGEAGVLKDKHVPEVYLLADEAQRRSLLMGLLDSDGHCSPNGKAEFTNTNKAIADAAHWLLVSLGYKVSRKEGIGKLNGVEKKPFTRLTFTADAGNPVFRMGRKACNQSAMAQEVVWYRHMQKIESIGAGSAQCLTVEGGLYLAGRDLVATHNCDGDGIEGTVNRAIDYINRAATALAWYREAGYSISTAHIGWLGDHIEGFASQGGKNTYRTPLGLTDQLRIMRRIMLHAAITFAPLADKLTMAAVPGNHGRVVTGNGGSTRADDNFDTDCLVAVGDALLMNPEAFGHVEIYVPGVDEVHVTVDVANTNICHVHGDQWVTGKHFEWWQGQSFGEILAGVDVMFAGHRHHTLIDTWGQKMFVQVPSLESVSEWYRQRKGVPGNPGVIVGLAKDGRLSPIEVIS